MAIYVRSGVSVPDLPSVNLFFCPRGPCIDLKTTGRAAMLFASKSLSL